jgi:hypothetical protein
MHRASRMPLPMRSITRAASTTPAAVASGNSTLLAADRP